MAYRYGFLFVSLCVVLQSVNIIPVAGHHVMFDNDRYMLDYEVKDTKIEFKITVSNPNGWVGLGINNITTMEGADIFIGGVKGTNETYGDDYYATENGLPKRDTLQDWNVTYGNNDGKTTIIHVQRLLNTNDVAGDRVIKNEKVYILWSYNAMNHDVTKWHGANKGTSEINLFEAPPGSGSDNNGSTILQGGLFTILVFALMAVLK